MKVKELIEILLQENPEEEIGLDMFSGDIDGHVWIYNDPLTGKNRFEKEYKGFN